MKKQQLLENGIPISTSLQENVEAENFQSYFSPDKRRLLLISSVAIIIAALVSVIAKVLVHLISFFTNVFFYGRISMSEASPASNTLGLYVILIPIVGGLIVGLMAFYGSKAIRGHGIPEAMEQILTNQSKIKPSITFLKPISAAISIGTGGPFGAEGPIIATGGALGSTIGQLMRITHHERKILLASGATAGMSAIFGTPIAAIFLAIELLLFEFSPRSIIPVTLACITGAAGHHLLFSSAPVFPMPAISSPTNIALGIYSGLGILIGFVAAGITRLLYLIEDGFEKLPIHWMWWPAIGGLVVGIVGFYAPRTLGVGYENITDILSGKLALNIIISLCVLKFISWAIALGSGTSGGTLAPLLTIGGATGAFLGAITLQLFPNSGINLPMAALIGMAAMFAGASRALLTSIIFALETTNQSSALLPLLAACTASFFISYFLLKNTIMTEKIARRGIKTPHSYEPDILEKISVEQVIRKEGLVISSNNSIRDVREWLKREHHASGNFFVIVDEKFSFKGIVSLSNINSTHHDEDKKIDTLIKRKPVYVSKTDSLRTAVEIMARESLDVLPVITNEEEVKVSGLLTYKNILSAYKFRFDEHQQKYSHISIKRGGIKILLRGQKFLRSRTKNKENQ